MKRTILKVLLLLFVIDSASAQTLEELNSRRIKERNLSGKVSPDPGGRKKWYDLDADDTTWGIGYNYSKHFPLTLNANYTISYFSISGELGVNLDKKKIVRSKTETDNPIMYLSVNPGLYCKYFSVNCGVGALMVLNQQSWSTVYDSDGTITETTITVNGNSTTIAGATESSSASFSITNEKIKLGLYLKPSIVGYIPISAGDYYITLNIGYMIMPKYKDLNGFSFGVGFQVEL